MRARTSVLDTAILGLLSYAPLHGYELRKRLAVQLGPFRAFSYGSLYPALKSLQARGLIVSDAEPAGARPAPARATATRSTANRAERPALTGRRSRINYQLTPAGKEHLAQVLASAGPAAWDDDTFDVRFALFGRTDAETRLRVLEGRRSRLTEKLERARENQRVIGSLDEYTKELQRHGLEQVEREVRWLDSLITTERERASGLPVTTIKERG